MGDSQSGPINELVLTGYISRFGSNIAPIASLPENSDAL